MATTKKEKDGEHPASHYLVAENPKEPSTWSLRVKDMDGTVNRRLLGAAWAALHDGYRGNKYEGPDSSRALAKLKAFYRAEKMPLPDAKMAANTSTTVDFTTDLADAGYAPDGAQYVMRPGILFECGDYPDKAFSFDEDDLARAVAAFTPVQVDLEHTPTVLDGKLGTVEDLYPSDDGKTLMGLVSLPKWLDDQLDETTRRVSCTWDRATKTLTRLALVRNPRVSNAALMVAFSADDMDPLFAAIEANEIDPDDLRDVLVSMARHDTVSGQRIMQRFHDWAADHGAVCDSPADMASRHEADGVQMVHDIAKEHGADCEPAPSAASGYPSMYSAPAAAAASATQPSPTRHSTHKVTPRSITMKLKDFILGQAAESGVEIDAEDAKTSFGGPLSAEMSAAIAARDTEIEALKRRQAEFDAERRTRAARDAANTLVSDHRIPPASVEAFAALADRILTSDSTASFAEGATPTSALLVAFTATLPDLSVFTNETVVGKQVAALFNLETTPAAKPAGEEVRPEVVEQMLEGTPIGREIIKRRKAAKQSAS